MGLVGAIIAIGNPVAQAKLLDALAAGAAEVDIVVEVGRARVALGQVRRHEVVCVCITAVLV
jgi:deoxyribose-phosphate aldolase